MAMVIPKQSSVDFAFSGVSRFFRSEKVVIIGDSITADNVTGTGAALTTKNHFGYFNVLDALMGGRFDFSVADNLGIAGNTSTQLVARLGASASGAGGRVIPSVDSELTSGATLAFLLIGINDINQPSPNIPTIKQNIKDIIDRIAANTSVRSPSGSQVGCRLVVLPITPRTTWNFAASDAIAQANLVDINASTKDYCATLPKDQVLFIEGISQIFDAGYVANGVYNGVLADSTYLRDTTHPSQLGAYLIAREIQKVLQPIIGHANSSNEIYNRLDRTKQKLLNHEFRKNAGGTGVATGSSMIVTGNIPNNWVLATTNFGTQGAHTFDISVDPSDGKLILDYQSFNGSVAGHQVILAQSVTAANGGFVAGDKMQAFLDVEYLECINAQAAILRVIETATVTTTYTGNFAATNALALLDKKLGRGLWSSPDYLAGAGVSNVSTGIVLQVDSSSNKTARLKVKLHGVHLMLLSNANTTQPITSAQAISVLSGNVTLSNTSGASYAVTLAAPTINDLGAEKTISMIAGDATNTVTLALTNIVGGTAANTATFNAAGQILMLKAIQTAATTYRWAVIRQIGVTLT